MRSIDRFALSFTPMLLRFVIGFTFLWAGAGKLFHHVQFSDAERAILTQLEAGVPVAPSQAPDAAPIEDDDVPSLPEADAPADDIPTADEAEQRCV